MFVEHNTVSYVQELWRNVCKSVRLYNYTIFICECVCVCVWYRLFAAQFKWC